MLRTVDPEALVQVLVRHLRAVPEGGDWSCVSLPDQGLDSMSAIDLVVDIEETFQLLIPEDLLVRETFATFASLKAAVNVAARAR